MRRNATEEDTKNGPDAVYPPRDQRKPEIPD